ncbi:MAG: tetratricopeptide repeat protein [Cytophagales bacterium]|nr:tetratricopeptide repeat protein [Cytophagales bacterium]
MAHSVNERVDVINELAFSLHNRYPHETLERSQEAIMLINKADIPMNVAKTIALKNMGLAYWRLANYDSSLYFLDQAIELAEVIEDDSLKAKVTSNMGLVYRERGEYAQSLKSSFQAYRVFQSLGDLTNEAIIANNIGVVYGMMENHLEALNYFEHSIDLGQDILNEMVICGNLTCIGETYNHLGDTETSMDYLDKAIIYCTSIRNNVYLSQALYNKATILSRLGKFEEATSSFQKALSIQQEIGELRGQANSYNALGELFLKLNDTETALHNLEKAYAISTENKLLSSLQRYYFLKIRIDSLREDYTSAQEDKALYKSLTDSLYHLKDFSEISEVILNYETENLRIERKLQDEAMKSQRAKNRITYILLVSAFSVILILGFMFWSKSKDMRKLKNLNLQIIGQKAEIDKRSEELRGSNSELRNTVNQLLEAQKQLVESEKMASLGQLAAGIGHEINNPLNFIKGGVLALHQELETSAKNDDNGLNCYFEIIEEGVNRATEIVKSLSHFSRLDQSMQDKFEIHEVIDHCLVILKSKLRNHITIHKDYHQAPLMVIGNEGRLHQSFINILSNAEQAIDDKGEISIATSADQNMIKVLINDTGRGIEESKLQRVMEPFFTTKPPGEGTGLGLSITYNIIDEHKGAISILSKPGEGCSVIIQLPLHRQEP